MQTDLDVLLEVDIYNGEHVRHYSMCEIHHTAYLEAGEFPMQLCPNSGTSGHMGSDECDYCELEQTVIRCSICGGETEHNWETHVMEMRADG